VIPLVTIILSLSMIHAKPWLKKRACLSNCTARRPGHGGRKLGSRRYGVIDSGQDAYINTTINGIGERAGNADLVAVILALQKSKGVAEKYQMGIPVHLSKAYKLCRYAAMPSEYRFRLTSPVWALMPLPMLPASMPTACSKTAELRAL